MAYSALNPIARINHAYILGVSRTPETMPSPTAEMGFAGLTAVHDQQLDPFDLANHRLEGDPLRYVVAATAAIHNLYGIRNVGRLDQTVAGSHRLGIVATVSTAVDFGNAVEFDRHGEGCTRLNVIDTKVDQSQAFSEFADHPTKLGELIHLWAAIKNAINTSGGEAEAAIFRYQNKIVDIGERFRNDPVTSQKRQDALDDQRRLLSRALFRPVFEGVKGSMSGFGDDTLRATVVNALRR